MPRCFKSTTYKATVRPFQSTSTHIVFSTWVHKHFDNIPSRNRDSYRFSIRVVNRQRRFVQFESSGIHDHPPINRTRRHPVLSFRVGFAMPLKAKVLLSYSDRIRGPETLRL